MWPSGWARGDHGADMAGMERAGDNVIGAKAWPFTWDGGWRHKDGPQLRA